MAAQPLEWHNSVVERTNEPKIVLLVRLLNAIDEGRYSFDELKTRIAEGERPPSTRTLRRYLAVLAEAGFPWRFDRPSNTYRFADGYSLKRLELTPKELFGLVALRAIGASLGGVIGTYVDEVTEKLAGSASRASQDRIEASSPVAFRMSEIALDEACQRIFSALSAAERNSRSVRFSYQDKEGNRSARLVDPYGFIVSGGRVYCVAYDHTRKEKRIFAVDSISELETLAQSFRRPEDFQLEAFVSTSISGVLHGRQRTEVVVRFASRVAKAAAAARVVSDRCVERLPDGAVQITYGVSDVDELIRWVFGWGPQAEIVTPQAARDRARLLIAEMAARYGLGASEAPQMTKALE